MTIVLSLRDDTFVSQQGGDHLRRRRDMVTRERSEWRPRVLRGESAESAGFRRRDGARLWSAGVRGDDTREDEERKKEVGRERGKEFVEKRAVNRGQREHRIVVVVAVILLCETCSHFHYDWNGTPGSKRRTNPAKAAVVHDKPKTWRTVAYRAASRGGDRGDHSSCECNRWEQG